MALVFVCNCGPPPSYRTPEASEWAAFERFLLRPAPSGFSATGKAHFESPDGNVDGGVEVRLAPPARAWLQVRTSALFDLVGARAAVALPGDGFLLIYQERGDQLDRVRFVESIAADLAPDGRPESLIQLAIGRIPVAAGDSVVTAERARVGGEGEDRFFVLPVAAAAPERGEWRVWLAADTPRRIEWWTGKEVRLEMRYDDWQPLGTARIPTRIQIRAPRPKLRARLELQELVPREDFGPRDFEVGMAWNPRAERGVCRG